MNALTRDELWKRLSEEGLVSGDPPVAAEPQSPWPVRAMLGIAGWAGAIFLFLVARSVLTALPAGAVCCIAAYAIFRAMPRNDFAGQFGLAISIAGQAMLLSGLINIAGGESFPGVYLAMAVVEGALAFAIPNYVHRVITAFAANFCLFTAAAINGAPALGIFVAAAGAAVVWLNQIRMAQRPSLWEPLGCGFAIALLYLDSGLRVGLGFWSVPGISYTEAPHFLPWLGQVATGFTFVYAVWKLRERAGVEAGSRGGVFTLAAAIVLALCGLAAHGISAAILVLVLGFANGNRVLMGLGLLAFGGYLSHFYYELSTTLLVKSMVLAVTGAVLLGLRWTIARFLPAEESTNA